MRFTATIKMGAIKSIVEWTSVEECDEGNYRFFKVGVGMPEKK